MLIKPTYLMISKREMTYMNKQRSSRAETRRKNQMPPGTTRDTKRQTETNGSVSRGTHKMAAV